MNKRKGKLLQKMTALLLSILLIAEALQSAGPIKVLAQEADIASGTDWVLDADGKLTISSDAGMTDWTKSTDLRKNKQNTKTVELLDGVTKIASNSFAECWELADVTIPSSVIEIEGYTFIGDDYLTNIMIPDSVTKIGDSAFYNCGGLESVTVLGENPAEIGPDIFGGCKFVEKVA